MLLVVGSCRSAFAAPLLPDLIAWDSQPHGYMYDGTMDQVTIRNKVLYRFSQPIANIGDGPLELREVTHANYVQDIYQRIYDSGGGLNEVFVGSFPNAHPPYGHLYLVGIAEYRLRTVTSGNGVGPIVASQVKTSYGLFDSDDYDTSLPAHREHRFTTAHYDPAARHLRRLGGCLSVERSPAMDRSHRTCPTANTGSKPKSTRLICLQETDNSNNITRMLVNLVVPDPLIMPGDYNQDDVVNAADYVVWRKRLGQNVTPGTSADGDGNGVIGMPDLDVWRAEFGTTAAGSGSSRRSRTDGGLMLLVLCACCHVRRRGTRTWRAR